VIWNSIIRPRIYSFYIGWNRSSHLPKRQYYESESRKNDRNRRKDPILKPKQRENVKWSVNCTKSVWTTKDVRRFRWWKHTSTTESKTSSKREALRHQTQTRTKRKKKKHSKLLSAWTGKEENRVPKPQDQTMSQGTNTKRQEKRTRWSPTMPHLWSETDKARKLQRTQTVNF